MDSDSKRNTSLINHVAFIMDGNRRWAKQHSLGTLQGHKAGMEKLFQVLEWCRDEQVGEVSVYAFSSENWQRSEQEVQALLSLMSDFVKTKSQEFLQHNIQARFIGERSRFEENLQSGLADLEEKTADCHYRLNICLSYGGRSEIVAAAQRAAAAAESDWSESSFEKYLWSSDMTDPDLVIRTGGHQRLSNFLLWRCAYSELLFTDTLWSAYDKQEFIDQLRWYRETVEIKKGL